MSYLGMGQNVAPSTLASIRSAKNRADLVFNDKVRSDLDRAIQTAKHLIKQRVKERGEPDPQAINALVGDCRASSSG